MSYNDPDSNTNVLPNFMPNHIPGNHFENFLQTCNTLTKPVDFFQLFFADEVLRTIAQHTSSYAWINIAKKQTCCDTGGAWKETDSKEMKTFIALLLYQGFVHANRNNRYWATRSLYHGLWCRSFMSRNRYQALLGMLHVSGPLTGDTHAKLKKVDEFIDNFPVKYKGLFQPYQNVVIDECLVKSKHRSGIRQYIANKPAKFGLKLWVIADSTTGYTYDFYFYTGKTNEVYQNGLGYHIVMKLMQTLFNQGYYVFFDNFYTSVTLLVDLYAKSSPVCGTVTENCKGFPVSMENGKHWAKGKPRRELRWQWIDSKFVIMLSTIDNANEYVRHDPFPLISGNLPMQTSS